MYKKLVEYEVLSPKTRSCLRDAFRQVKDKEPIEIFPLRIYNPTEIDKAFGEFVCTLHVRTGIIRQINHIYEVYRNNNEYCYVDYC